MDLPRPFLRAKARARKSNFNRVKMGCVICYKNTPLAYGENSYKTSPTQKKYNIYRNFNSDNYDEAVHSVHAEIAALNKVKYLDIDWSKIRIYIYREKCNGSLGLARPCAGCLQAIKDRGIKKIYYTTDCGWAKEKLLGGKNYSRTDYTDESII